jgi:hypothetical protein
MNKLKSFVALLGTAALLAMSGFAAFATSPAYDYGGFTDLTSFDAYANDIKALGDKGIVGGYDDGDGGKEYLSSNEVNRAEMMKIIAEAMALGEEGVDSSTFEDMNDQDGCFSDIPAGQWYTGYLCYGKSYGWVGGYSDGSFKPGQPVTFAEALKITYKGFGVEYTEPTDGTAWYMDAVNKAESNDWIPYSIDGDYQKNLTRGEMAGLINYVAFEADPESSEPFDDDDDPMLNDDDTTTEVDGIVFNADANYTGPFPAPEGMVLEGTYGSDSYWTPTGDGTFQFEVQTSWEININCLDDTRTLLGSKGGHWDDGFYAGYDDGNYQYDNIIDPIYDDTPAGTYAGDEYYDEGYEYGYERGFDDLGYYTMQWGCAGADLTEEDILDMYDDDGWYVYEQDPFWDEFPSLMSVAGPPGSYSGVTYSSQSMLGADSESMTFDAINYPVEESELNTELGPLNLSQIDVLDGELEGDEADMTTEEFAQALYDGNKYELEEVAQACVLGDPLIVTETFGSNEFTQLAYTAVCDGKWNQIAYLMMKNDDEDRMLILYFMNPDDVANEAGDDYDLDMLINVDFVNQFLENVVYE